MMDEAVKERVAEYIAAKRNKLEIEWQRQVFDAIMVLAQEPEITLRNKVEIARQAFQAAQKINMDSDLMVRYSYLHEANRIQKQYASCMDEQRERKVYYRMYDHFEEHALPLIRQEIHGRQGSIWDGF